MFFRIKSTKTGKVLKLLESFRDCEGTPRHRTVVSLGTPTIIKEEFNRIAYVIEKHFYDIDNDFIYDSELTPENHEFALNVINKIESENRWIPVKSISEKFKNKPKFTKIEEESIEHEIASVLGPVLVAKKSWDDLKFDKILKDQGLSPNRIQSSMISERKGAGKFLEITLSIILLPFILMSIK